MGGSAAKDHESHFTFVSSDAVFSGPWMFHDEESQAFCPSDGAQIIRQAEKSVSEHCPESLIIRSNVFGWSPAGGKCGWIDQILLDLDRRSLQGYDFLRHGTPILATDLADILLRAIEEDLSGLHHVAGAERVNPLQFATRLADHFELPWLAVRRAEECLEEPIVGFGASETSSADQKDPQGSLRCDAHALRRADSPARTTAEWLPRPVRSRSSGLHASKCLTEQSVGQTDGKRPGLETSRASAFVWDVR